MATAASTNATITDLVDRLIAGDNPARVLADLLLVVHGEEEVRRSLRRSG